MEPERFGERYPHQLSGASASASPSPPRSSSSRRTDLRQPVSMLDASVRAQILNVLVELRSRRGLGLIFITHDLSLAWSLCDRIAVMYLGRIVEEGSALDVIERPRHPYTQALVDAVPVPTPEGGGVRVLLSGELPDETAVPSGCRFHPRCPKRFEPSDRVDTELYRSAARAAAACLRTPPAGRTADT